MSRVFKAVIAGFGYMGEIRKRVIENHPHVQLVGVYDSSLNQRQKVHGCNIFESYEELLQSEYDMIFVCTPNLYSPQICIDNINRGKHVFCEKPPGRNVQDVKRIIEAEKGSGNVKLMFGFNHRFHPGIMRAKVIIEGNRLGKVINIRGLYGKSGGIGFKDSWRNDKEISGGGILLDQGIHMLDLFRFFCGDFESVKCFLSNSYWKFDTEDNAYVILQNSNGQDAFFHSSATMWKHTFRIDITLENGYLIVEGLLSKTGSYGREKLIVGKRQFEDEAHAVGNPVEEITYFDRDLSWDLEVEAFVEGIEQDIRVSNSNSEDALKVMEIIEKAYRNANVPYYP